MSIINIVKEKFFLTKLFLFFLLYYIINLSGGNDIMKKNKVILIVAIILTILILISIGIFLYRYFFKNNSGKIEGQVKPQLKVEVLKDGKKVGKAIGNISSWKNNDSIFTTNLVTANEFLKKEKFLEMVKAGDMVKLSTEGFAKELTESIYEITYNAISDEDVENPVLPIDEVIDYSNGEINIPILRENIEKTLYYYINVNFKDRGTVVYYFKVKSENK